MSNDVVIPADLGGGPATIFKEQNVQTERLGDGIDGSGFPIIGVNGKAFYLRYKKKVYPLINPPSNPPTEHDGMPAWYFDFVILRKGERRSHTYYKDGYKPGLNERPICVSTDGIAPDDSVEPYNPVTETGRQSDLCDICPRHEWKKQANGRDGRECADSLRLSILPMPRQMIAVLGEPITEATLLRVPAASLTALAELGDMMTKRFGPDTPFCTYIIRATFKQGVEWPQFEYRVLRFIKEGGEAATVLELRESPQAYRILGLTPDGKSLVRRNNVIPISGAPTRQIIHSQAQAGPPPETMDATRDSAVADKLAAERAARIAAVRGVQGQPQTIDVVPTRVEPQVPIDDVITGPPSQPAQQPVQQTQSPAPISVPASDDDIDKLLAGFRPQSGA